MRYLGNNPRIIKYPAEIDVSTFRWTVRNSTFSEVHLPLGASVNDKIYLLSDFNIASEYIVVADLDNMSGALSLSLAYYGTESVLFSEWLKLFGIAKIVSADIKGLLPPGMVKNIRETEKILSAAPDWPAELIKYIDSKQIPFKTLYLLTLMSDRIGYVTDFVIKKSPSVQKFRQFTEDVRDFSGKITGDIYSEEAHKAFTERRSVNHIKLDALFNRVNGTVTAVNRDNFETNTVHWSFTTSGKEDFTRILNCLTGINADVDSIYNILDKRK